ncbi:MAG TPA: hypothetical protein VI389_11195 [Geobacteraceae bacterium]
MSERHTDSDGSDIFWPGYVDAVTNLVLNLLFLLTIMTVAVFMFALELGRATQGKTPTQAGKKNPAAVAATATTTTDLARENSELKREIERLNTKLAERGAPKALATQAGGHVKTVDVASNVARPANGIDKTVVSDFEVLVRFTDEAVSFSPAERDRLRESLQPLVAGGKASLVVEVPAGFTEAKRMGFYRVMAVRNLLIEMKMPKDAIATSVREVKHKANAAIVRVKAR